MTWRRFDAPVDGGVLVGYVQGDGPRLLLVHGGPALSGDYLEGLADELTDGYEVAWYQQRSLAPSVETGPFTVEQHVRDLIGVLDALDWPSAWLVGHSWGGHLVVATASASPERLSGVVSVDPLGCVGDGRAAEFEQAMFDRTSPADRERAEELDERPCGGRARQRTPLSPCAWSGPRTTPTQRLRHRCPRSG